MFVVYPLCVLAVLTAIWCNFRRASFADAMVTAYELATEPIVYGDPLDKIRKPMTTDETETDSVKVKWQKYKYKEIGSDVK